MIWCEQSLHYSHSLARNSYSCARHSDRITDKDAVNYCQPDLSKFSLSSNPAVSSLDYLHTKGLPTTLTHTPLGVPVNENLRQRENLPWVVPKPTTNTHQVWRLSSTQLEEIWRQAGAELCQTLAQVCLPAKAQLESPINLQIWSLLEKTYTW